MTVFLVEEIEYASLIVLCSLLNLLFLSSTTRLREVFKVDCIAFRNICSLSGEEKSAIIKGWLVCRLPLHLRK